MPGFNKEIYRFGSVFDLHCNFAHEVVGNRCFVLLECKKQSFLFQVSPFCRSIHLKSLITRLPKFPGIRELNSKS